MKKHVSQSFFELIDEKRLLHFWHVCMPHEGQSFSILMLLSLQTSRWHNGHSKESCSVLEKKKLFVLFSFGSNSLFHWVFLYSTSGAIGEESLYDSNDVDDVLSEVDDVFSNDIKEVCDVPKDVN